MTSHLHTITMIMAEENKSDSRPAVLIFMLCLKIVSTFADSGTFYISSVRSETGSCQYDRNKCKHGLCRETKPNNGRDFLCACPPKKTGPLCEKTTADCLDCLPEARKDCTGLGDGTAVCICLEYKKLRYEAPSICFFRRRKKDRQGDCKKHRHNCTPGQECVDYARGGGKSAKVCQCPVGNIRGPNNCEQEYEYIKPGNTTSCVDANKYGPICMCKKYGPKKDEFGFCKAEMVEPRLFGGMGEDGPCSLKRNKCRHGQCIKIDKEKFVCACYGRWRGKYCHIKTIWCDKCEKDQRYECLGLEDATVVCICEGYYKNRFEAPSLCFFPDPHKKRQGPCGLGRNDCEPGKECVNYALSDDRNEVLCQCPIGRTRGIDCIEDYKFISITDNQPTCIYSDKYGPFCVCKEYGRRGNDIGFCKPRLRVHGAVVKPKGSGGPCDVSVNRCRRGICIETEPYKGFDYICACPPGYTGRLCHHKMLTCVHCVNKARTDCIGLPDGTAVCVCIELVRKKRKYGKTPLICYYKRYKITEQKRCRLGKYECATGKQCVNYAQYKNRDWMLCQCQAGKKRGKYCSDDYKLDRPSGRNYCVDTILYGPICMCDKYPGNELGFCIPQLHKSAGYRLVKNAHTALLHSDSPCRIKDICKGGTCIEEKGSENSHFAFLCSCPNGKTGRLCHQDMLECYHCKDEAREDCIGIPDGTTVCICLELENRKKDLGNTPLICYYKMFKDTEQKKCKDGSYECPKGKQCVNFAQYKNRPWLGCHCPAGKKRGDHCKDDYKVDRPSGRFHCVDTLLYGPICMCGEYRKRKYGFCIPEVKESTGYKHIKNGYTALIKPDLGSVCDPKRNICNGGTCFELPSKNDPNFELICSCPLGKTGKLCQREQLECYHCKDKARRDCIGLPDGTAVCVCLELENRKKHLGTPPLICYYKRFQKSEQGRCQEGRHSCSRGKQCVNYQQYSNRPWVACQCQAGEKRGKHCEEDYVLDRPTGRSFCIDTLLYGPLCMCNRYGDYGFCVPLLKKTPGMKTDKTGNIAAAKSVSPCEASKNICKGGTCMELKSEDIPNFSFICSCPLGKTGKFCEEEQLECYHCKNEARRDCIGLPDGTGLCVCLELENRKKKLGKPPLICYYKMFFLHWQKRCRPGRYQCSTGKQCVNYAQFRKRDWMACQCVAGKKRGEYCHKNYVIDRPAGRFYCADTLLYGPVCMCNKYHGGEYGFCIPDLEKSAGYTLIQNEDVTALVKSSSPCTSSHDVCNGGKCYEEPSKKRPSFAFICACPAGKTGKLCQREQLECYHCKDKARRDCIGLPDGRAVCICLELENRKKHRGKPPLICYYKPFQQAEQGRCRERRYRCPEGKDCVNYQQYARRPWVACECLAGKKRGEHCDDDYIVVRPGENFCVDTLKYGPICMCKQYAGDGYGFCKPKLKKKSDSACDGNHNICREGKCIEANSRKKETKFICSCPFGKTGKLCNRDMYECSKCRESALTDCISLPDGTAVCICVELEKKKISEEPVICYFNKAKEHEQKFCHGCSTNEKCVIYEGTSTCQCSAGGKRGRKCKERYKTVTDPTSCVDTGKHGPICVCDSYGGGFSKFGFCKPNIIKKKRSKKRGKRELLVRISPSEQIRRQLPYSKYSAAMNSKEIQTFSQDIVIRHRAARSVDSGSRCNCKAGKCIKGSSDFICACPTGKTGRLCNKEQLECYHCKDKARAECIGLPDGTAVCVCLELENRKKHLGKPPLICYYKRFIENKQGRCKQRKYKCPSGKKCVNYAQYKNRPWVACQCEAGKLRGKNCKDEYVEDTPGWKYFCVDTLLYGPICMCAEYGGRSKYGFCIPKISQSSGYRLIQGHHTAIIKPGSVCETNKNICNGGTCIELPTNQKPNFAFICSCPLGKIGNLCQREMIECYHCKDRGRRDCMGLPDGRGVCICLELENRKRHKGQTPLICYYKVFIENKQGKCKKRKYRCPRGKQCINYAQYKNRPWVACQCLAGKKRGNHCEDGYREDTPSGRFYCVDTLIYGPICMCRKYDTKDKYGFCIPKVSKLAGYKLIQKDYTALVKPGSVCDIKSNICNGGTCIELPSQQKPNFAFMCSCPVGKTGNLCQREQLECYHCKDRGRRDCIGLPDGTAVCICLELENRKRHLGQTPLICYYKVFKKNEQGQCKKRKYRCPRGLQCVNYAQYKNRPWVACQCLAGKLRGKHCEDDYLRDIPSGRFHCVDTKVYGPICMCRKYSTKDKYGFCIPKVSKDAGYKLIQSDYTALVKTGSVCKSKRNVCNGGTCIELQSKLMPNNAFICSCPLGKTGKFCQKVQLECYHCKDKARADCIGLPDGRAVCVCLELENRKKHLGVPPLICYYKMFIENWQGKCKKSRYKCPKNNKCVDYAQYKNRPWVACQCEAGKKRGKYCDQDYVVERPGREPNCVDTLLYGPVCLCGEYSRPKYGLCIPQLSQKSGYKLIQNGYTALIKSDSPCLSNPNICNGGKCMEEQNEEKTNFKFICSCPVGKTGKLCQREQLECYHCKDKARAECIGLPDGTAVCVCLELENRKKHLGQTPLICYYKQFKEGYQKSCKKYKCPRGSHCVNYQQFKRRPWRACQCPAGQLRGKRCEDEYLEDSAIRFPCVDTLSFGPICMCNEYSRRRYGFCIPKVVGKVGKPSMSSSKKKNRNSVSSDNRTPGYSSSSGKENGRFSKSSHKETGRYRKKKRKDSSRKLFSKVKGTKSFTSKPSMSSSKKKNTYSVSSDNRKPGYSSSSGKENGRFSKSSHKGPGRYRKKERKDSSRNLLSNVKGTKSLTTSKPSMSSSKKKNTYSVSSDNRKPGFSSSSGKKNGRVSKSSQKGPGRYRKKERKDSSRNTFSNVKGTKSFKTRKKSYKVKQQPTKSSLMVYQQKPNSNRNSKAKKVGDFVRGKQEQGVRKKDSDIVKVVSAENIAPTPHFIDPGWKKKHPCSSNPCLNNGTCKPDSSNSFTCICPILFRGNTCNEKMLNLDLKLSEKDKATAGPLGVIVVLVILKLCCIIHCIRVSSKRKDLKNKYDKVIKKGEEPTAELPGCFTVSNDLLKQTFCCGTSSLPSSFAPKKKKKKKDKEKQGKGKDDNGKKETDKKDATGNNKNQNENFPFLARKFGRPLRFSKHVNLSNSAKQNLLNRSNATMRKYLFFTEKLKEKGNKTKNVKKLRKQFVKEYLKYHHDHFWSKQSKVRCQKSEDLVPGISSKVRCQQSEVLVPGSTWIKPQMIENRQQLEYSRFSDDTDVGRVLSGKLYHTHKRSKSFIS